MQKILIVDDDRSIRELYRYIFTDLGYEVETAEDGKDGLGKVQVFNPDCILVDFSMPEMTGDEFARELHESPDPGRRDIPFVVMTGDNDVYAAGGFAFGANPSCKAFLPKIVNPDSVVRAVQAILDPGK